MNYWLTTHWPPRVDDDESVAGTGVWVPEGRQQAAEDMRPGDYVAVYESRSGRIENRTLPDGTTIKVPCKLGREGMICYGTADSRIRAIQDAHPEAYADGTEVWWRWYTPVSILSRTGFVPRSDLLKVLGYKPLYRLRGFGDRRSGLKKITEGQFRALVRAFHASRPIEFPENAREGADRRGGGGEGIVHLNLKNYVASNPAVALNESGLRLLRVEYQFPTNDRADIVLMDQYDRIVGVEIEPSVRHNEWAGLLQAIKYKHLLECVTRREPGDSRGVLIAHEISANIKTVCASYGIECREISRNVVDTWVTRTDTVAKPPPHEGEDRRGVRERLTAQGLLKLGTGNAAAILDEPPLVLPASVSDALAEDRNDRL